MTTAAGISPTTVTTTQQAPLGFELTVPTANAGNQTWVYVLANDALIEGKIVMLENAASAFEVNVTPTGLSVNVTAERVVGVAQHVIAAASYGFVLAKGFGSIRAGDGAALTVNTAVTMGGGTLAGTGLDFATGTTSPACVIGHCTVGAAAENNATCYINVT
jgi:hypothetical protein